MRLIKGHLTQELDSVIGNQSVSKAKAFPVSNFRSLMQHVAKLAFLNKDYLLFFRGQSRDFKNKAGASTFYPSIYRGDRVSKSELELRFEILKSISKRLCIALEENSIEGYRDVRRRRYIQWSILQHYEVCPTPLLDLTHSLRVACSFAFEAADKGNSYVSVFGLPYVTNRISINSEHDIVIIRLLSICPPDALRPYFQEGYLAGTDEITSDYDSKDELDFNNRLIAKFLIRRHSNFWGKGFGAIPKLALFPAGDRIERICRRIKDEIGTELEPGQLGKFLQEWTDFENIILTTARQYQDKVFSLREGLSVLVKKELIPSEFRNRLERLRLLRNRAVHEPRKVKPNDLKEGIEEIFYLKKETGIFFK